MALSIIGTHLSVVVITLIPLSCNLMIFKAFLLADVVADDDDDDVVTTAVCVSVVQLLFLL